MKRHATLSCMFKKKNVFTSDGCFSFRKWSSVWHSLLHNLQTDGSEMAWNARQLHGFQCTFFPFSYANLSGTFFVPQAPPLLAKSRNSRCRLYIIKSTRRQLERELLLEDIQRIEDMHAIIQVSHRLAIELGHTKHCHKIVQLHTLEVATLEPRIPSELNMVGRSRFMNYQSHTFPLASFTLKWIRVFTMCGAGEWKNQFPSSQNKYTSPFTRS